MILAQRISRNPLPIMARGAVESQSSRVCHGPSHSGSIKEYIESQGEIECS